MSDIFTDVPPTFAVQVFLEGLIAVRRDLSVDPLVGDAWTCEPDRCRPLLGPYLCCKVERRCIFLEGERCRIHDGKPFACALFPLDLVRIGGVRVLTTPKNLDFFATGWSRYDRDMLRCFEGPLPEGPSMFEIQKPLLAKVFKRSEMRLIAKAVNRES